MKRVKTIDAEVAGEAVRLVVDGGPSVPGRTMAGKLSWLRKNGGDLRRLLMLEPRGHAGMHGAGFPLVSGESIIAAVTIALEHRLIDGVDGEVCIDTPVGLFRAWPRLGPTDATGAMGATGAAGPRVTSVAITGVPSFVHSAGVSVRIGTRNVTVDIAFGGEFYAIADSEAIGIPIDMAQAAALAHMGREIKDAVASQVHVQHPLNKMLRDIQGTIFTGAPRAAADLRSATVLDGEVVRRSPGATGTAALMAVLDAMGLLTDGLQFTHEGVLGTTLRGSIVSRRQSGGVPLVTPVIEGAASVTGLHEFVV